MKYIHSVDFLFNTKLQNYQRQKLRMESIEQLGVMMRI